MSTYTFVAFAVVIFAIGVPIALTIQAVKKGGFTTVLVGFACILAGFVVSMSSPDYLPYLLNSSEIDENSAAKEVLLSVACLMLLFAAVAKAAEGWFSRHRK